MSNRFNPLDENVYDYLDAYVELHGMPPESIAEISRGMFDNPQAIGASIRKQSRLGRLKTESIGSYTLVWPVYCACDEPIVTLSKWDRCAGCGLFQRPWTEKKRGSSELLPVP